MYLKHLTSLQFLTYVGLLSVVVAAVWRLLPGKAPPLRTEPFTEEELGAHDSKAAKYFVAAGFFLVLGSIHMVVKNLPWAEEYLARTGYAGHLVRDLSNTHLMIVGGGTLLATGLTVIVGIQTFLIVGGVTRLIPLTGITLPFVSYGGSSIVANFILIALLMRLSDAERVA